MGVKTLNHQSQYDTKIVPDTAYADIIIISGQEADKKLVITTNDKLRVHIED